MSTVTVTAKDAEGHTTSATASFSVSNSVKTLFGADGTDANTMSRYPNCEYHRVFSPSGAGIRLPNLLPTVAVLHLSFKDTPTSTIINKFMDTLTRPVWLEYNHEPEGDMASTTYISNTKLMRQLVSAHPNAHYVTFVQTFTRYAQVHGKNMTDGVPATYQNLWVPGASVIGMDCEHDYTLDGPTYPDPKTLFAAPAAASKALGVPFAIPELGWQQMASDTDGSALAQWYTDCAAYLKTQNCAAVAAFDQVGTTGNYLLTGKALAAWQTVVANQ